MNGNKQFEQARMISDRLVKAGADQCLLVGGCVRDHLLGIKSKDLDIEVYGLTYKKIVDALSADFAVDLVGKSFGVVKVENEIDVSIPRSETKSGVGHKGFNIEIDPYMSVSRAARRRDFTINSIAMDINGIVIDPLNGRSDLEKRTLRACSTAFREDPLRVLRGVQFASRFEFSMDPDTVMMCQGLLEEYDSIAKERVFEEWRKWAVKGKLPKHGLDVLAATQWITKYPDLLSATTTPQDPAWHPEGDVYTHTGHVCNSAVVIADRENLNENDRLILIFAALCHDLGKAETTIKNEDGRWVAPKHTEVGVHVSERFLQQIHAPEWLIDSVKPLVGEHMAHLSHQNEDPSHRTIRRLANRLAPVSIRMWSMLCEADQSGRPPLPKSNPVKRWEGIANQLAVNDGKPEPILMGRHLLDLGFQPGKGMGNILGEAFEQQLDGVFHDIDGAVHWVKSKKLI